MVRESQLHTTCSTKVIWAESLNFLGKTTGVTVDKCSVTNCPFSSGISFKSADHHPVIMSKTDSSWYRVFLKPLRYSFNVCSIGNCESVKLDFSNCYKRIWEHTIVNGRMCWKCYTDMPLSTYCTSYCTLEENVENYLSRLWVKMLIVLQLLIIITQIFSFFMLVCSDRNIAHILL